jgi:hypothetical protein
MSTGHWFAAVAVALAAIPLRAQVPPSVSVRAPEPSFDEAMQHYAKQDFRAAFHTLASLADGGHPDAARIALMMRAHGTRLFGHAFTVDAQRRARWLDVAAPSALGLARTD